MSGSQKYEVALVRWLDISSEAKWQKLAKAVEVKPHVCDTIGYLINQSESTVLIADTVCEDGDVSMTTVIPKGVIVSLTYLGEKNG